MAVLIFVVIYALAFAPLSTVTQLNPDSNQSQNSENLDAENLVVLPVEWTVKIRRKVTYVSHPNRVSQTVSSADSKLIRSVLVPKTFSYAVVQQPENNPYYVSSSKNLVTEFSLPNKYNNIGLLAHNTLAGKSFMSLNLGQEVYVVHSNGHRDRYIVSAIYRFQALEPTNTESQFRDLDSNKTLTATELFDKMYTGEPRLTLQTCIAARGESSWGRLFVIATPATTME